VGQEASGPVDDHPGLTSVFSAPSLQYQAKRLAGKNVSEMIYSVSSRT